MITPCTIAALCLVSGDVDPVRVFTRDAAGFAAAAPHARLAFSFDAEKPHTDLTGTTVRGVSFEGPAAPLFVERAADTSSPASFFEDQLQFGESPEFRGKPTVTKTVSVDARRSRLSATSGAMVLSPGGAALGPGPNPAVENDDVTLRFDPPVQAFAFDLLTQDADGQSNAKIRVIDGAGKILFEGDIPISSLPDHAGGADFWGIVSSQANIARVEIDERDDNDRYPDCNIGLDSLRMFPAPLPADLDGDGDIDEADRTNFAAAFAKSDRLADLNADDAVDAKDLEEFRAADGS